MQKLLKSKAEFETAVHFHGGTVIGIFVNLATRVECICASEHTCYPLPTYLVNGRSGLCTTCNHEARIDATRKRFLEALTNVGATLVGTYTGFRNAVDCLCINGHPSRLNPDQILHNGVTCFECKSTQPSLYAKAFYDYMSSKGSEVLGDYKDAKTTVLCVCSSGHVTYVRPVNGTICSLCRKRHFSATEQHFKNQIETQGGEVIGEYTSSNNPVHCICAQGHHVFPRPSYLQQKSNGNMCTICAGRGLAGGLQSLETLMSSRNIKLVGPYKGSRHLSMFECDKGHQFSMRASSLRRSGGYCSVCFPKSYGEELIATSLTNLNLVFRREFRFGHSLKRFDFEVALNNTVYEYDGQQHFFISQWRATEADLQENQLNDIIKMRLAFQNGYKCVRFDWECKDYESAYVSKLILFISKELELQEACMWLSDRKKYNWVIEAMNDDFEFSDFVSNDIEFGVFGRKRQSKLTLCE